MSGEQFGLLRAVAGWSFYSNDVGGAYVKQNSRPQNGVPIPSKAVARLRSLAGDPWTRRNSRPVSLSEGAMALLAIAASAMAQAQQACAHEPEIQGDRLAISDPAAASAAMMASPLRQVPPGPPTDHRTMKLVKTIGGAISPKSVNASGTGLVFAQNMMYRHTITVYDSAGALLATIPDSVNLATLGVTGGPTVQGAPVEAAFTPDARYAYVSNYSMYGPGQGTPGSDFCTPGSAKAQGNMPSYVYRVDAMTLKVDQAIKVGLVPKYLVVSPDGRYLLVSNWCSWDLYVVDVAKAMVVADLAIGPYPRGIAVSPDSSTAYVAIMGGAALAKVSLSNLALKGSIPVGVNPRHVVMDPRGNYLYASLNSRGEVVKVDLATEQVVGAAHTGWGCRSLAISTDGLSLYVVNYDSNSVTKLRTRDLAVLQTLPTGPNPVGVTYDPSTGDVWVGVYSGQILVFADQ
jgi:YVTN family beta-propeller protein